MIKVQRDLEAPSSVLAQRQNGNLVSGATSLGLLNNFAPIMRARSIHYCWVSHTQLQFCHSPILKNKTSLVFMKVFESTFSHLSDLNLEGHTVRYYVAFSHKSLHTNILLCLFSIDLRIKLNNFWEMYTHFWIITSPYSLVRMKFNIYPCKK